MPLFDVLYKVADTTCHGTAGAESEEELLARLSVCVNDPRLQFSVVAVKQLNEKTVEDISDIIGENCITCKRFWEDIHTSPCICENIADAILYHGRIKHETEYVAEWERQQGILQMLFGNANQMSNKAGAILAIIENTKEE